MAKRIVTVAILLVIGSASAFLVALGSKQPSSRTMPQAPLPAASGLAASEEHVVTGHATQAARDALTLRTDDGRTMTLRLDDNTNVLLDGEKAVRDELQQGDEVRAAYQGAAREPIAIRIEAASPTNRTQAASSSARGSSR